MKLKYLGKDPFRLATPARTIELEKGDTIDVPERRGVKWLDDPAMKGLWEEVKGKKKEDKS